MTTRMSDTLGNNALIAAFGVMLGAIFTGVGSTYLMRKKYSADAASSITSAAMILYGRSEERVDDLERELVDMRERFMVIENDNYRMGAQLAEMKLQLEDMTKENERMTMAIDELWDGIVILSEQLNEANIKPGYVPGKKPIFRGGNKPPGE